MKDFTSGATPFSITSVVSKDSNFNEEPDSEFFSGATSNRSSNIRIDQYYVSFLSLNKFLNIRLCWIQTELDDKNKLFEVDKPVKTKKVINKNRPNLRPETARTIMIKTKKNM